MVRLTVANDNRELLDLMGEILEGDRHVATLLESLQDDLLQQICRSKPDLLMIDLQHGDEARRGWEIAQELRGSPDCEHLPVVLCSADLPALNDLEPELEATPGVAILRLPFELDELLDTIRTLLDRREAFRCS